MPGTAPQPIASSRATRITSTRCGKTCRSTATIRSEGPRLHRGGASSLQLFCPAGADNGDELARVLVLTPDAERLLRGTVGDRKQHRLLRRAMRIALPGRHHEHVVGSPFQHLILDRRRAAAFCADENGVLVGTIFLAIE